MASWMDRALTWAGANPASRPVPPWERDPAPRGLRHDRLSFTVDISAELRAAWLGNGAYAPRVSRAEALSVPAVKRVRDLICATLGTLRLRELDAGMRATPNGLLAQPEPDIARSITYTMTAEDMLFEGHAWWRILSFTPQGWPDKIRRLEARSVRVQPDGKVYYRPDGTAQGMAIEAERDDLLIRFDSPWPALLVHAARTIRDAMALARAGTRNVENPVPVGYFRPKSADGVDAEDPEDIDEILDDWKDGVDRHSAPYLNGALEFVPVQWNPEQLQFKETRDAVVLEVARAGNIDPEELGVSTTTRTYANAEQRRLDLLDFTEAPLLTAISDRLSMPDVVRPNHVVRFSYDGFLRSDTLSRMQVYAAGREVGAYDDERIAEIEEIPVERVRRTVQSNKPSTVSQSTTAQPPRDTEDTPVENSLRVVRSAGFTSPDADMRFSFDVPATAAEFRADSAKRIVSGMVLPWNVRARSGGYTWEFAPNSLHWSTDTRVKLDKDHGYGTEFGRGVDGALRSNDLGLMGAFKVGRSVTGDEALNLAEDGVYDGFSAFVTFDGEGDGYEPHPDDPAVRRVYSATLRKVALTANPAFDDARVQSVAANRQNGDHAMNGDTLTPAAPSAVPPVPRPDPASFDVQEFATALTRGMAETVTDAVVQAVQALPGGNLAVPQRQVVPAAGGAVVTREAPVYAMNGQGPSFVRDAWRSRTEGDPLARERLMKFERMTTDMVQQAMADPASFAVTTGNAGAVIPPGFRPDLYISQLLRGRPMTNMISRGTIADATPFKIPAFISATGATADHVEGTNPTDGSLSVGHITVSPGGISGKYTITREIADSSNPAIDAIATQAMSESWSQQTEAKVYNKLNGTDGVGGVITSDFVPSGAQAYAITVDISDETPAYGRAFGRGLRAAMAKYPFRRFGPIDWGVCSQEGATLFAESIDSSGRALFPWTGAQNAIGTANTLTQGYIVDGLVYAPAWSMTGNAAGDADLIFGNRNDAWCWESPVLNFRFEEVAGPANVVLALFGYHAVEILRPVGLAGVRITIQA